MMIRPRQTLLPRKRRRSLENVGPAEVKVIGRGIVGRRAEMKTREGRHPRNPEKARKKARIMKMRMRIRNRNLLSAATRMLSRHLSEIQYTHSRRRRMTPFLGIRMSGSWIAAQHITCIQTGVCSSIIKGSGSQSMSRELKAVFQQWELKRLLSLMTLESNLACSNKFCTFRNSNMGCS